MSTGTGGVVGLRLVYEGTRYVVLVRSAHAPVSRGRPCVLRIFAYVSWFAVPLLTGLSALIVHVRRPCRRYLGHMPMFLWITPRPCLQRLYNSCSSVYIVLLSPALLSSLGFSAVGVNVESLCRCRPSVNVGLLCYTSGLPWLCAELLGSCLVGRNNGSLPVRVGERRS
jgi:hypothetical protein